MCSKGLYSPGVSKYPLSEENWKFDQNVSEEMILLEKLCKSSGGKRSKVKGKVKATVIINAGKILLALLW